MILTDLDLMMTQADNESPALHLREHSENVAKYSLLIFDNLPEYEKIQWKDTSRTQIYDAGMYHDIGKAFIVRFRIGLLEKTVFTEIDRFNVQEHVTAGVVLLQMLITNTSEITEANSKNYVLIRDACLYHHERTDGSGYLKTTHESIPKIGELVAVADSFSAGIEKRIYGNKKTWRQMLEELKVQPYNQIYVNALERGLNKLTSDQT